MTKEFDKLVAALSKKFKKGEIKKGIKVEREHQRCANRRCGQAAQSNSSSPGGLTEAEVKTPMTIYRAGDASEVGVKPFSSWSPDIETAKKYLDNPGFGGDTLRTLRVDAGSILDADTTNRPGMRKLAVALGFDAEKGDEWFDDGYRYPWEESSKVSQALKDSGFDAVRYKDDFPEGATTIIFTKEPKLIRSSFDTSAPALGAPVQHAGRLRGAEKVTLYTSTIPMK